MVSSVRQTMRRGYPVALWRLSSSVIPPPLLSSHRHVPESRLRRLRRPLSIAQPGLPGCRQARELNGREALLSAEQPQKSDPTHHGRDRAYRQLTRGQGRSGYGVGQYQETGAHQKGTGQDQPDILTQ